MSEPRLAIVIPTIGRSHTLEHVLAGVANQQPGSPAVEVVVSVDAAAEIDATVSLVRRICPSVEVVQARRSGASAARNHGWQATTAPLVLFLDDDVVPSPQLVSEHMRLHQDQAAASVGVVGRIRWSSQVKVTPFMRWLDHGIQFNYQRMRAGEVSWWHLYSCNFSLRRTTLDLVGGFDEERFPFGYEDLDLGRRLADRGLRLLFNPAALGEHLKTETLESFRAKLPRIAASEQRFIERYPEYRPYFHDLFQEAASASPARGRLARLAGFVPPALPWLGDRVWRSLDMSCRQRLAPTFLDAWGAQAVSANRKC